MCRGCLHPMRSLGVLAWRREPPAKGSVCLLGSGWGKKRAFILGEKTQKRRKPFSLPRLQVNLRRKMLVSGLMTQGASHAGFAVYVKTFRVAYSSDGHKFQFIQDMEGSGDKVGPSGVLGKD